MSVSFAGNKIVRPGVYSRVNIQNLSAGKAAGGGTVAYIGQSKGGEPNKVYTFQSPKEAAQVLRGGDLLEAINAGYSAVASTAIGPARIMAIRVANGASQASVTVKDESGDDTLTFTSKDYGVWTNNIKVIIEDATLYGKKVTVKDTETGYFEIKDNLGDIFTIQYTGDSDYARMSTTLANGTATNLLIEVSDDDTTYTTLYDIDLTKPEFDTIIELYNYLNGQSDISITLSPYLYDKTISSGDLPAISNQDIKTAAYKVSNPAALIKDYLTNYSDLVSVDWASTSSYKTPANTETFLSGGADGTVPSSWADAIALLETEDVRFICPLTGDQAIHNEVKTHVDAMSSILNKKRRIGVVGGVTGESVEDAINEANGFNDYRMVRVFNGVYYTRSDTGYSLQPSWFTAAIVAGALATGYVIFPITNKAISVEGVEYNLSADTIERLIENGVVVIVHKNGGYIVEMGVTTYIGSIDVYTRIFPTTIIDYIQDRIEARLEPYIGSASYSGLAQILYNAAADELNKLAKENYITPSGDNPAWRNLEVTIENNVAYVSYEASPIDELDYILITHKFTGFFTTVSP